MLKLVLACLTICNKSVKICFSGNICQVWRGRQDRLRASRDICLHFLKYPPFQHNPARSKELSEERDTFGLPRSTNRLIHFFCQKGCLTSVPYTAGADAGADNDPIWFWLSLDHIFLFFCATNPPELWALKREGRCFEISSVFSQGFPPLATTSATSVGWKAQLGKGHSCIAMYDLKLFLIKIFCTFHKGITQKKVFFRNIS